jgi:Cu/Zn superoxide dismutase
MTCRSTWCGLTAAGIIALLAACGAPAPKTAYEPVPDQGTPHPTTGLTAVATIGGEGISGTAEFREIDARSAGGHDAQYATGQKAVEVRVTVTGLTPGAHGMHLHAIGVCEAPFTSAGGHFDPGPASDTDPDANHPFHMGDLPNLVADASGRAEITAVTTRVTLSPGPLSVFDEDGTAIIIHANPDQGVTGEPKSGLSGGPRAACGVILRP